MKTQSIKSIATLLGVAVVLNVNAFAGPGPQPQVRTRNVSTHKSVAIPSSGAVNAPTIALGGTKFGPTLVTVSGPHGTTYLYRW